MVTFTIGFTICMLLGVTSFVLFFKCVKWFENI